MLQIRETFVNTTKGYQFSETEWYEPFTQDRGELLRSLQKEYGQAVRMYVDLPVLDAEHAPVPTVPIGDRRQSRTEAAGWVFSRRELYEDARGKSDADYYTREVWVQVRDVPGEG
jgi:hypothetical protein